MKNVRINTLKNQIILITINIVSFQKSHYWWDSNAHFLDRLKLLWLTISIFITLWKNLVSQACSGDGTLRTPNNPCLWICMLCVVPSHTVSGLVCATKYGRSNGISFSKLDHCGYCLSVSLWSFPLGDISCCIVRTLRQPCESSCGKVLRPPATSHMNEPSWQQILQLWTRLQMSAASSADSLTTTSWQTVSQNWSTMSHPGS